MKNYKRYCQALDLVDDEKLINEYETIHKNIWPEVYQHIKTSGVVDMQIWRIGTRLFMIMDVDDTFSFERSGELEKNNPIIKKWESQMWKYQKATPWTPANQKWVLMEQIFELNEQK
ncbi:L-rhamnose mutarotase [Gilliamella sp. wkB112]|uniref:L-rhamnose mutarotase n=1 Tax=Gilliamella sp. wkB112 TaxID=3120257 RepID=UPI00080E451D|nr:L-rhamnose mutarotase [Gilliamella apicola]OCG01258.1 L-fucose mutarotase [Gilliamella apicola]